MEAKMAKIEKTFTSQMTETQESIDEVIAALERRQMDTVMKMLDHQASVYFMQLGMLVDFLGYVNTVTGSI
jgi:DNA-binding MurR/RpiR family transcriptional regulator